MAFGFTGLTAAALNDAAGFFSTLAFAGPAEVAAVDDGAAAGFFSTLAFAG